MTRFIASAVRNIRHGSCHLVFFVGDADIEPLSTDPTLVTLRKRFASRGSVVHFVPVGKPKRMAMSQYRSAHAPPVAQPTCLPFIGPCRHQRAGTAMSASEGGQGHVGSRGRAGPCRQ